MLNCSELATQLKLKKQQAKIDLAVGALCQLAEKIADADAIEPKQLSDTVYALADFLEKEGE